MNRVPKPLPLPLNIVYDKTCRVTYGKLVECMRSAEITPAEITFNAEHSPDVCTINFILKAVVPPTSLMYNHQLPAKGTVIDSDQVRLSYILDYASGVRSDLMPVPEDILIKQVCDFHALNTVINRHWECRSGPMEALRELVRMSNRTRDVTLKSLQQISIQVIYVTFDQITPIKIELVPITSSNGMCYYHHSIIHTVIAYVNVLDGTVMFAPSGDLKPTGFIYEPFNIYPLGSTIANLKVYEITESVAIERSRKIPCGHNDY